MPCRGHPLMPPSLHLEALSCSGTQLGEQIHVVLTGIFCQVFCKVGKRLLGCCDLGSPNSSREANSMSWGLRECLGQEFLSWQGTSSLRCGREGTKGHSGILVGAGTQQDFWLKDSNILSSGTPKLSILNNSTFTYINIEIPSLLP